MAAVMGLLLFCPSLALKGARSGLLLWFHTVLPTLLPFMLCSSAIVAFGAVPAITRPLAPLFSRLSLSENGPCFYHIYFWSMLIPASSGVLRS